MRRPLIAWLVLSCILAAGCSLAETAPSPPGASSRASPAASPAPAASIGARRPLPSGFPVLSGALPAPMPPDDPGLVARWETDQLGSAAYDYYATALPAAGYPIVGLYPGGAVAIIRFSAPGGEIWQVVAQPTAGGRESIEVRLDRP